MESAEPVAVRRLGPRRLHELRVVVVEELVRAALADEPLGRLVSTLRAIDSKLSRLDDDTPAPSLARRQRLAAEREPARR